MAEKLSITIDRQYGSGGREIGVRLGEMLGFRVYDEELLTLAAQKKGVHPDYLRRVDEKATDSLLYMLALGASTCGARQFSAHVPVNDQLFMAQSEIIKDTADSENAVFVGRCADHVLRKKEALIRVFIYADKETRVQRVSARRGISRAEASDLVVKTDRRRANYYKFYTGHKWGLVGNYDLMLNSSLLGVEGTAALIAEAVGRFLSENDAEK